MPSIETTRSAGLARLEKLVDDVRRKAIGDATGAELLYAFDESARIAREVAQSITPNLNRDYIYLKAVQAAGGNVSNTAQKWNARGDALVAADVAARTARIAIRAASTPAEVKAAVQTFRSSVGI